MWWAALINAIPLLSPYRELLLRENRILRSQLEEHLVTSRTSRAAAGGPGAAGSPAGPGAGLGPGGGRSPMAESKLRQARMLQVGVGPGQQARGERRARLDRQCAGTPARIRGGGLPL